MSAKKGSVDEVPQIVRSSRAIPIEFSSPPPPVSQKPPRPFDESIYGQDGNEIGELARDPKCCAHPQQKLSYLLGLGSVVPNNDDCRPGQRTTS
eukprot:14709156-Ditylum_brightwellii.AAC.1